MRVDRTACMTWAIANVIVALVFHSEPNLIFGLMFGAIYVGFKNDDKPKKRSRAGL